MKEIDKILKKAEQEHNNLKHPYVGTEHLLLAILSLDNELTEKLKEYKLTYNKFKRKLIQIIGEGSSKSPYLLYTPMLRKVIDNAEKQSQEITAQDLFDSIIQEGEGIAIRILEAMKINIKDIKINNNNYMVIDSNIKITNRDKEIEEIMQILMRKNKCNPLLLGEAGVGKTAIVEELQRRLLNTEVPTPLKGYKIKNIDISSLVAGTKYRGDFEDKINNLLKNIEQEKTIIFIDEIHTLVNAGGAEGAISAGDIIKPYLARGTIKCIGATTLNEYHKYFEIDEALNRRFQTIIINEPNTKTTINILENIKENYETYHHLKIENNLIPEIVNISCKYLIHKHNPDKSIELLDSCCTNAKLKEEKKVSIKNLYQVLEYRYGLNLNNKYIKEILDTKQILTTNTMLEEINYNCNYIKIDGNNYKDDTDLYKLLGNPYLNQNSYYILKNIIDKPLGIIYITNYNYNEILKEFINKLLTTRHILNNYGQDINLENYIIILENIQDTQTIGFTKQKSLNNIVIAPLDEKLLVLNN